MKGECGLKKHTHAHYIILYHIILYYIILYYIILYYIYYIHINVYTYIKKNFANRFLHTINKLSVHHKHHVPRCLSCYKAILVMSWRTHSFHDYICAMPILLLQDLRNLYIWKRLFVERMHQAKTNAETLYKIWFVLSAS